MNSDLKLPVGQVSKLPGGRVTGVPGHRKRRITGFYGFILLLLLPVLSGFTGVSNETARLVAAGIQAGNAEAVAKHFNTMVDLSLPGYDDTYSKTQASQILKDFFANNPVQKFRITKQGASEDGSKYAIGELETGTKKFRVYFLIKTVKGKHLVHQMQIQEN